MALTAWTFWWALMTRMEDPTGSNPCGLREAIPNSVSTPTIFSTALAPPLPPGRDEALDRPLLRPGADALDHGAADEVPEVEDLLLPGLVGDLQEPIRG